MCPNHSIRGQKNMTHVFVTCFTANILVYCFLENHPDSRNNTRESASLKILNDKQIVLLNIHVYLYK